MRVNFSKTNVLEYIPMKYIGLSSKQLQDRRTVFDFKDGNCPESAMEQMAEKIKEIVGANASQWVICFIPASTKTKHLRRFGKLAKYLQAETHCEAYIDGIDVKYDRESGHIAGKKMDPTDNMSFNPNRFSGKKVILIDDVITRGVTFEKTASIMMRMGATTVFGVFLAKTIHPDLPIDPNPHSYGWEHDIYSEIMQDEMAQEAMQDEIANEIMQDEMAQEAMQDEIANEIMQDEIANEILQDEMAQEFYEDYY